jgi:cysteine sulfinate desulfinase/cysteine desulfurase-like protein
LERLGAEVTYLPVDQHGRALRPAAMGIRPDVGMGAIRFSLGRHTAIEEIDAVVDRLTDVLAAGSRLTAKPPDLVEGTERRSL